MKKIFLLSLLATLSFSDEDIPICPIVSNEFESRFGKIETKVEFRIGSTGIANIKSAINYCYSFQEFISNPENKELYKLFLKEKFNSVDYDSEKFFLELILNKRVSGSVFIVNVMQNDLIEANENLKKELNKMGVLR